MLEELDLCASVIKWGTKENGNITAGMGRTFVASCIEQGRFHLTPPLTPYKAVERALGHVPNSSQNKAYFTMCINPPKVSGVHMRKVTTENSITLNGTAITHGVYLVRDPSL
jgi:hypothetical protein